MAFDAHKNFVYSTILTAPSTATAGTTLVVQSGDGTKFPAVPFNATVWPAGAQPTASNSEIVRVTNISTDTFTITRGAVSGGGLNGEPNNQNRSILVGDQIAATVTTKLLTDIETATARVTNRQGGTTGDAAWNTAGTSNTDVSAKSVFKQVGVITTSAGAGVVVTFPVAFNQKPIVVASALVSIGIIGIDSISATTFTISMWSTAGARIAFDAAWEATGQ